MSATAPRAPRKGGRSENALVPPSTVHSPVLPVAVPAPLVSPTPSTSSGSSTDTTASSASASSASAKDILQEAHNRLSSGEYVSRPKVFAKGQRRSAVWDAFHVVVDRATNLEAGTAQCIACESVLTYSVKSGVSSLKKHMDNYCSGQLSTATSAAFRPVPGPLRDVFVDKVADTGASPWGPSACSQATRLWS